MGELEKKVNKLIDFIHVGDYKTGTTWLQEAVFPLNKEIQYLGDHFSNLELQKVLRELVDARDLDFNAIELRKRFIENFIREKGKAVGISREAFSQSNYITGEHAKRNAERLKEVFGKTKIIYVIREQISMLGSIYSQYIKTGGTRSFNDWFLDPIECKGIIERLKYHKNIEMYYDIFGKENVLVLLFEELKYDKPNFLKKIYTHIGCKDVNFQPAESNKKVNTSLTVYGAFFARFFNGFFRNSYHNYKSTFLHIDKLIYSLLSEKYLEKRDKLTLNYVIPNYESLDKKQRILYSINMGLSKRLEKLSDLVNIGRKLTVPLAIEEKIKPIFKESNKILKDTYLLEVDRYKWEYVD